MKNKSILSKSTNINEDFNGFENTVEYEWTGNEGDGVITKEVPKSNARDSAHGLKYQTSGNHSEVNGSIGTINEEDDKTELRLVFYDFDGTLADNPQPETGKSIWENAKGKKYPHIGWWSHHESLDLDVFDIKAIPSIQKQFKKDKAAENTKIILLTNRLKQLEESVKKVLDSLGYQFDEYDYKQGGRLTKGDRIEKYITDDVTRVDVYDNDIRNLESCKGLDKKHDILVNRYRVMGNSFMLV